MRPFELTVIKKDGAVEKHDQVLQYFWRDEINQIQVFRIQDVIFYNLYDVSKVILHVSDNERRKDAERDNAATCDNKPQKSEFCSKQDNTSPVSRL